MSSLPFHAIDRIDTDGRQLIDVVTRAGLDAPVPSCAGWTTGDLAWHVGEAWEFWTTIVRDRITDIDVLRSLPDLDRPGDGDLIDWVGTMHSGLLSTLVDAPTDTEVWTWTGANRDAQWVRRRMAHETAVHRWDAETAVGETYRLPIALATDGIDEFLEYFSWRGRQEPLGGTVSLHRTDSERDTATGSDDISAVGGEWFVSRLDDEGIDFDRLGHGRGHDHATADATIRGSACDLLLWVWGRDAGPVDLSGDVELAERFRTGPDLS